MLNLAIWLVIQTRFQSRGKQLKFWVIGMIQLKGQCHGRYHDFCTFTKFKNFEHCVN